MQSTARARTVKVAWAYGYPLASRANPSVVYSRIRELQDQLDHEISAPELILEGRNPSSPLHGLFTWDDKMAADHYRKNEAISLINCLRIRVIKNGHEEWHRAFVNIRRPKMDDDTPKKSVYVTVERAMSTHGMKTQVLERALAELSSWRERYADLLELSKLFAVMDEVLESPIEAESMRRPRAS